MDIKRVDHYSIRTLDLEASRRFYTEVIGLKVGPRPPFDFPGFWLYSGDPPADLQNSARNYGLVHLMGVDRDNPQALNNYVGERDAASLKGGTGALDHVAFAATGRQAMVERCRRGNVKFFERSVPILGLHQMFLTDPDGVTIELNYPASEAPKPASTDAMARAR
ncbi:MAG TPA: VOC family protein [Usitatibacter sp.]|nr:VOC family protein [Usitatibacter sp.]